LTIYPQNILRVSVTSALNFQFLELILFESSKDLKAKILEKYI